MLLFISRKNPLKCKRRASLFYCKLSNARFKRALFRELYKPEEKQDTEYIDALLETIGFYNSEITELSRNKKAVIRYRAHLATAYASILLAVLVSLSAIMHFMGVPMLGGSQEAINTPVLETVMNYTEFMSVGDAFSAVNVVLPLPEEFADIPATEIHAQSYTDDILSSDSAIVLTINYVGEAEYMNIDALIWSSENADKVYPDVPNFDELFISADIAPEGESDGEESIIDPNAESSVQILPTPNVTDAPDATQKPSESTIPKLTPGEIAGVYDEFILKESGVLSVEFISKGILYRIGTNMRKAELYSIVNTILGKPAKQDILGTLG